MRFGTIIPALAATAAVVQAVCPMAELIRRGAVPKELAEAYKRGEHPNLRAFDQALEKAKRDAGDNPPAALDPLSEPLSSAGAGSLIPKKKRDDGENPPAVLDPLSGPLSELGLGSLIPRDANPVHRRMQEEHAASRLAEREEDADINARILTPKAAKRHVKERGLIGGLLAPLTGPLAALDVPTPQDTGLKAIPGSDPNHQYQPPGPTDVRGDCPTLNTLANHGYLSRNGITTFAEAANACGEAFSLAFDLSVILSAFGLLAGGDIVTGKYSIGGQDSRVPNTLGPALGLDRHGLFELDASISRSDAGLGDNHNFNQSKWNDLVSDANQYGGGLFNLDAMKNNAAKQYDASLATNPDFQSGANFAFRYAIRALTTRPLPNGTTYETADYANIAPFFLQEQFPTYWYRRPIAYGFVDLLGDIVTQFLYSPRAVGSRSNGGPFVPANITFPTDATALPCFLASFLINGAPGQLSGDIATAGQAVINQIIKPAAGGAGCNLDIYATNFGNAVPPPDGFSTDQGSGSGIHGNGTINPQ